MVVRREIRKRGAPEHALVSRQEVRCCMGCKLDDCYYSVPDSGCRLLVLKHSISKTDVREEAWLSKFC